MLYLREERSLFAPAFWWELTRRIAPFFMMKYFAYARKSTEEEERQQLSIDAQIYEIRKFASSEGFTIVEIFTESKTAKHPGRPVFDQIIKRINKGEANGILSWHPDRLSRNAVDAGKIFHLLSSGKLRDLKFPSFWFDNTPQGKFMLNLAFGQSQYFLENLSVNTKRGLLHKARQGWMPSQAPKGYLNHIPTKTIIIDKKVASRVKKAFGHYSTGRYSLNDISLFFAQKGITNNDLKPIHIERIRQLLMNPFYYGYFKYGGELYEGKHKPLIAKKLFDKVQETLRRKGPNKFKKYKAAIRQPYFEDLLIFMEVYY